MTRKHTPMLERLTDFQPLSVNIALFVIAIVVSAIKASLTPAPLTGADLRIETAVMDVFISFAALELAYLIIKAHRLQELLRKTAKDFRDNSARDALIARLDERVTRAQSILQSDDLMLSSIAKAAFRSLDEFSLVPNGATIDNEKLTISFYSEFWRELVRAQERSVENKAEPITVYTTHSASIRIWRRPEFTSIRSLQDRFLALGGIVNRVLINQSNGFEKTSEYVEAIAEMTHGRQDEVAAERFNMFYIERLNSEASIDDFLLVSVSGAFYSALWETNWQGSYGSIVRCRVHTDEENFRTFWGRWCEVVAEAAKWMPNPAPSDPGLSRRPSRSLIGKMTALPSGISGRK